MSLYKRWIHQREHTLTLRDRHRRIFPFDFGLHWVDDNELNNQVDPLSWLKSHAREVLENSEDFFTPPPLQDYTLQENILTFATPTPSIHPENNRVYCRLFPADKSEKAVIILPQWNADSKSHVRLCQVLRRCGITAARLSMPYHDWRTPGQMQRADYMVSPNVGRTLHATRQAVLEVRQLASWLRDQGYSRIGVMGTSMGSCVSYLAFVHEPLICTGVFNHVSSLFADVVWTGLSTRYIRWGLEGNIKLEDLRQCWAPISPWYFVHRLKDSLRPHLLITAKYDLTFAPHLFEKVLQQYKNHSIPYDLTVLPCGHYTMANFPFKYLDGWHICRYLMKQLSEF